jgi:nucleolar MIF4G domain-containing protein 1
MIQPAVAHVGEAALSVRTKFMIDTITDLKNNRMKTGATTSAISIEYLSRVRKMLGFLNSRTTRASEPLRIGRMDIHNSAKNGKWWLVGASWKEDPSGQVIKVTDSSVIVPDTLDDVDEAIDLAQLAKAHRMNTDVRRSIFVAIMSASDYRDAHIRLAKLRLKRRQELEIPPVLIHCAAEEEAYNPYYTVIARKLCSERKIKVAFAFSLWGMFKRMGERGDMDVDLDEDDSDPDADSGSHALNINALVNLAKMYGSLIADGVLALGILKTLDFAYLKPKTRTLVELLLITIILQTQQKRKTNRQKEIKGNADDNASFDENPLRKVFLRAQEAPQVVAGLIYFLRKVVAKSDVMSSKWEKKVVSWGCRIAVDTLRLISEGG